jgi:hypothetical protein
MVELSHMVSSLSSLPLPGANTWKDAPGIQDFTRRFERNNRLGLDRKVIAEKVLSRNEEIKRRLCSGETNPLSRVLAQVNSDGEVDYESDSDESVATATTTEESEEELGG